MDPESPIVLKRADRNRWTLAVAGQSEVTLAHDLVRRTFKPWIDEIRMAPVQSTSIALVGYDPATWNLVVEFQGGSRYLYLDVEPETAAPLLEPPAPGWSIGKYHSARIKAHPDLYPFRKVN